MPKKIGVYICHCGTNIAGIVDVEAVTEFSKGLANVTLAKDYKFMCSDPGQELLRDDIKASGLDGVVIAACSPLMHERTFRKAALDAGLNPFLVQIANIREQCSWVTTDKALATEKAMGLVAGAVARLSNHEPLEMRRVEIKPSALVVGAGIAGIQAALDLADAGVQVHLVEREPTIGGYMAMFDKTFPTLDCAACILTPKMTTVGAHPNINLMAYSEVEEVSGFIGSFKVKVRRKASYVDNDKCNGCGICIEKCPYKTVSEFDQGLVKRKAIFTPFPQAVPNKPVIDRDSCAFFLKGKCRICEKVCEVDAIDFEQQDRVEEYEVGTIIVATGFQTMDMTQMPQLGYGKHPDVYSALEFERLNNASGPTLGRVTTKDGRVPQSVAILHCTGSRDENHHRYCSRVCCMYALKYAHLIKEKMPEAAVYNFYIDMRCFGKGYEEFYMRLQEEGVRFIRGKAAQVWSGKEYKAISTPAQAIEGLTDEQLVVQAEDTLLQSLVRVPVDMVVLTPAFEAQADAPQVAKTFLLSCGADGFFIEQHPKLGPVSTTNDGVFIAGGCQGPKDIPDTVAQGSAAAAKALSLITRREVEVEANTAFVEEELCSGCKSCLDICPYNAIDFDEEKNRAIINEALCKACGTCAATCPSGAIRARHFSDDQIFAEIEGVMSI
ncbi:MAG: CoB--CoM heterodisulfide reductase iron-sulfur subunit A family protein [Deltaproteobacteria bacterium]|nr:CoB--CoM heterodisulfide reductase iron-sulfur subunit A family protein [Deltaproteobacteria bacterium]